MVLLLVVVQDIFLSQIHVDVIVIQILGNNTMALLHVKLYHKLLLYDLVVFLGQFGVGTDLSVYIFHLMPQVSFDLSPIDNLCGDGGELIGSGPSQIEGKSFNLFGLLLRILSLGFFKDGEPDLGRLSHSLSIFGQRSIIINIELIVEHGRINIRL